VALNQGCDSLMNAKKIAATLTALKLDGWHLTLSRQERCTLHTTTNEAIETSIDALREEAHITIYKKFGKQIGNASFVPSHRRPRTSQNRGSRSALDLRHGKEESLAPSEAAALRSRQNKPIQKLKRSSRKERKRPTWRRWHNNYSP
jgi:hypothetical protein